MASPPVLIIRTSFPAETYQLNFAKWLADCGLSNLDWRMSYAHHA